MDIFSVVVADDKPPAEFLASVRRRTSKDAPSSSHVIWLAKLDPTHRSNPHEVGDSGELDQIDVESWDVSRVTNADVLVIDLDMPWEPSAWARALGLPAGGPFPRDEVVKENGSRVGLAGCSFVRMCGERLRSQLIILRSAHADDGNVSARVRDVLQNRSNQQILIYNKTKHHDETVVDQIVSLYENARAGFTRPQNQDAIEFAANHDEPVLIVGESGTGKEVIARSIHARWAQELRRRAPHCGDVSQNFAVVNCGGLSPLIARSELFGHVKGSFTDAHDHNIGKLLWSCGCREIGSIEGPKRQNLVEVHAQIQARLDKAAALLDELEAAERVGDSQGVIAVVRGQVMPLLDEYLADRRGARSFARLVYDVSLRLQAELESGANAEDFKNGLLAAHKRQDLLAEDGRNVEFKQPGPFGTVFLDEFGDLPLEVQTLLLRYLQDYELQPIGFPGVIRKARVRIIAATSDPRVAAFVGVKLSGSRRSVTEELRPLRHDLLFRIKGQVIRTEPVTEKNVRQILDGLIRHASPVVEWSDEAKDDLVEKVADLIKLIDGDLEARPAEAARPVFGHKRELTRVVTLVNAFVSTARARGVRRVRDVVEPADVEAVWSPSWVTSVHLPAPLPASGGADSSVEKLKSLIEERPNTDKRRLWNQVIRLLVSEVEKTPRSGRFHVQKSDAEAAFKSEKNLVELPRAIPTYLSGVELAALSEELSRAGFEIDAQASAQKERRIVVNRRTAFA